MQEIVLLLCILLYTYIYKGPFPNSLVQLENISCIPCTPRTGLDDSAGVEVRGRPCERDERCPFEEWRRVDADRAGFRGQQLMVSGTMTSGSTRVPRGQPLRCRAPGPLARPGCQCGNSGASFFFGAKPGSTATLPQ
jgi:hypothetical protein